MNRHTHIGLGNRARIKGTGRSGEGGTIRLQASSSTHRAIGYGGGFFFPWVGSRVRRPVLDVCYRITARSLETTPAPPSEDPGR